MLFKTTDLCDQFSADIQIAQPIFTDFGKRKAFGGIICTIKVFEDNVLVRRMLEKSSGGKVLVVDGGGSLRCALLGDQLAELAIENEWSGVLINGCIRDSKEIADIDLGVKALAACPMKSIKKGEGEIDVLVRFAGIDFAPGHFLYADEDGVITSKCDLLKEK